MLVESLILQRLNTVPKRRHQDWIRALLVQGFLAESGLELTTATTMADGAEKAIKAAGGD